VAENKLQGQIEYQLDVVWEKKVRDGRVIEEKVEPQAYLRTPLKPKCRCGSSGDAGGVRGLAPWAVKSVAREAGISITLHEWWR